MLILLTAFHTLHIFYSSLTDFQNFPEQAAFFQDFPVLENAILKFQYFPGFPGPVRTLTVCINLPSQVYIVPEQTAAIKKKNN